MRPFSGDATVAWHTPKHDPEARTSVEVTTHIRKVQLQPAFSQTPQYLAAVHALHTSLLQYYKVWQCSGIGACSAFVDSVFLDSFAISTLCTCLLASPTQE